MELGSRLGLALAASTTVACLDVGGTTAGDDPSFAGKGGGIQDGGWGGSFSGNGGAGAGGTVGSGGSAGGSADIAPQESGDGLQVDGIINKPDACGGKEYYVAPARDESGRKVLRVGPDASCGGSTLKRAYLRFPLVQLQGKTIVSAKLRLRYRDKSSPGSSLVLHARPDWSPLQISAWSTAGVTPIGDIVTTSTAAGSSVELTVTNAVKQAGSAAVVAFELRAADESEAPGPSGNWYDVIAAEDGNAGDRPTLTVTFQ